MFICKDCGKKFDIKPDYCDCGNDEFTQEFTVNEVKEVNEASSQNITPKRIFKSDSKQWLIINAPSLIIFCICIILSVIIFLIKDNSSDINQTAAPVLTSQPVREVDWTLFEDNTTNLQTPVQKVSPSKSEVKQIQKVQTKSEPKKQSQYNTVSKKGNNTDKTKTITKTSSKTNEEQLKKEQENKAKAEALAKEKELKRQQELKAKQELVSYKNAVAKIFYSKINFTNIIGNGSCEITFKIDSSGNILNKNFSKLSQNTTLNDSVFLAVNNISKVSVPPSGYKGETLHLKVNFSSSGGYSVSVE